MNDATSYLDRRLTNLSSGVSSVYSGGVTTWTLPYSVAVDGSEGTLVVALEVNATVLTSTRPAANQIAVAGPDYTLASVIIGVLYAGFYVPSTVRVRNRDGSASNTDKLTLRRLMVLFTESTNLSVIVRRTGGPTSRVAKAFTRTTDGEWSVPVHGVNELVRVEISDNGSPGVFALNGFVWEGDIHPRARPV